MSRPTGSDVRADTEDGVIVIFHDGVIADIDGEDGGEQTQPVDDPSFTVGVIAAGVRVESIEESTADASGEAVENAWFTFLDVFATGQSHLCTSFDMSNGEVTECAKKKKQIMDVQIYVSFPKNMGVPVFVFDPHPFLR